MALPSTFVDPTPYRRPRPLAAGSLRVDGNEGDRPPAELLRELATLGPETLRDYPDSRALEEQIADRYGVEPQRVVVTGGADDALDRCCRAFLGPGRGLVLPVPTFEMLHRFAGNQGAEVVEVPWEATFPTAEVVRRIGDRTALVVIVSPNNPTGAVTDPDALRRVAQAAAGQALVVLDQVYREYADVDLTTAALDLDNVVLVHTLSKAWGLAGCRVGYAIAPPRVTAILRSAGSPYPTSTLSLAVASARLAGGESAMNEHVAAVRRERQELTVLLEGLGVSVPPSQANFVLPDLGNRAAFVCRALRSQGVLVRYFPHRRGLESRLRISLPGAASDFQRLRRELLTCLDPQALLFDLDGVLADVSESYDAAIVATAAAFNCRIEAADIEHRRRQGDANNDWRLTCDLLAQRGVEISLDAVTRRFQEIYLGSDARPGLAARERLLTSRRTLAGLAGRYPLAVVTGRPRGEAARFLERFELTPLFRAVIAMEDAPAKPDPAPVRMAMERLGVERAWMIGDTVDDLAAAHGAGALGLAVVSRVGLDDDLESRFEAAGAATTMTRIDELERYLP